jgi:regulatory protein
MPPSTRRPQKQPVTAQELRQLALSYVARYATTRAKLARYLGRKIAERSWAEDTEPPIAAITSQMVDLGFIDDAAFALSRKDSLLRRGYGEGRVRQAFHQAGIESETSSRILVIEEDEAFQAALTHARKRRFGPYSNAETDPRQKQKQLASMLRAGHSFKISRQILDLQLEVGQDEPL